MTFVCVLHSSLAKILSYRQWRVKFIKRFRKIHLACVEKRAVEPWGRMRAVEPRGRMREASQEFHINHGCGLCVSKNSFFSSKLLFTRPSLPPPPSPLSFPPSHFYLHSFFLSAHSFHLSLFLYTLFLSFVFCVLSVSSSPPAFIFVFFFFYFFSIFILFFLFFLFSFFIYSSFSTLFSAVTSS